MSLGSPRSTQRGAALSEVPEPDGDAPKRRREFDFAVVTICGPVNDWPAGTQGVIVDAFETKAMVEIADKHGRTLDLLTVPYAVISVHAAEREREPLC